LALKSIVIPSSVEILGSESFANCDHLAWMAFEPLSQLHHIEAGVFSNCSSLQSICIPATVTRIDARCFMGCKKLSSIPFDSPSRLQVLSSIPFISCSSIDIPDSVEVLDADLALNTGRNLVLSFGCNSHLSEIDISLLIWPKRRSPRQIKRAFVRLPESTLKAFRLNLSFLGA
jgi:hypothetical protein